MITDLDRTLESLLVAEMPIKNGEVDIKFDQPKRDWSAKLSRPTLNLFLFDVRENVVLRQHQWNKALGQGNGHSSQLQAHLKRTPFRLDCHYMLTAWAADPQDEHLLLSHAMLALFRYPILPKDHLAGEMQEQPFDLQTRLASHDRLTNPAEMWGSLDNEIRLSISYIVTLAMDPWAIVTTPIVRSRILQTGQALELPQKRQLLSETSEARAAIGGAITQNNQPQPGVGVAIKNTGYISRTNSDGQFRLDNLPPGDHTLVIWPTAGSPIERPITVPADHYNIDL